jgi:hypothetical protein
MARVLRQQKRDISAGEAGKNIKSFISVWQKDRETERVLPLS